MFICGNWNGTNAENSTYAVTSCITLYLTANIPVQVTASSHGSTLGFDRNVFDRSSRTMDSTDFNVTEFGQSSLSGARSLGITEFVSELYGTDITGNMRLPSFSNPLLTMAGKYASNPTAMMADVNTFHEAQIFKQRFFSEAVLVALSDSIANISAVEIAVTRTAPRLVVNFSIAITIGILLFLLGLATVGLLNFARFRARPLGLAYDPNVPSTVALLVQGEGCVDALQGLDQANEHQIKQCLRSSTISIDQGQLMMLRESPSINLGKSYTESEATNKRYNWRQLSLCKWTGAAYSVLLAAILSALVSVCYVKRDRKISSGIGISEWCAIRRPQVFHSTL